MCAAVSSVPVRRAAPPRVASEGGGAPRVRVGGSAQLSHSTSCPRSCRCEPSCRSRRRRVASREYMYRKSSHVTVYSAAGWGQPFQPRFRNNSLRLQKGKPPLLSARLRRSAQKFRHDFRAPPARGREPRYALRGTSGGQGTASFLRVFLIGNRV